MQRDTGISAHEELRQLIRTGRFRGTTSGHCPEYVQANLVILPRALAADFRRFCDRNPIACPLIEQTAPGQTVAGSAPTADLRTDVPGYRIYRDGALASEVEELGSIWREDFVTFLLGCSFNFEPALALAGIPLRHQEQRKTVPMYVTNRACQPSGPFRGPLVVSMRPVQKELVPLAVELSSRYPQAHGGPLQIGEPKALGIRDLDAVDFGEAVSLRDGEVPLFWACGVTPQAAARSASAEIMITHAPGCMFLTDRPNLGLSPSRAHEQD